MERSRKKNEGKEKWRQGKNREGRERRKEGKQEAGERTWEKAGRSTKGRIKGEKENME